MNATWLFHIFPNLEHSFKALKIWLLRSRDHWKKSRDRFIWLSLILNVKFLMSRDRLIFFNLETILQPQNWNFKILWPFCNFFNLRFSKALFSKWLDRSLFFIISGFFSSSTLDIYGHVTVFKLLNFFYFFPALSFNFLTLFIYDLETLFHASHLIWKFTWPFY